LKPTQGVILIMIAALILFLTWSSKSALKGTASNPLPGAAPGWGGNLGSPGWTPKGSVSGIGAGTPNGGFTHTPNGILAGTTILAGVPIWTGGPLSGEPVSAGPSYIA
jgi:hypothetical protein